MRNASISKMPASNVLPTWPEMPLESVALINPESLGTNTPATLEFHYIDISSVSAGVIDWGNVTTQNIVTAPSRARRIIRPGDVLFCTVRPGLQAHAFADWQARDGYICSTGFAVIRAKEGHAPRYLFHLAFSDSLNQQVKRYETGSNYPAINETDVRSLVIPVPAFDEQRRIAKLLDTVDAAIRLTEALIAKHKQMKAGLLRRLLTRGIDKNGRLRDPRRHPEQFKQSPLRVIPKEWEIFTLGELAESAIDGPFGSNLKTEHYVTEPEVRVVRLQNIESGYFDDSDKAYVSYSHANRLKRYEIVSGDLLIASMGDDNHPIARACLFPSSAEPGIVKADCFRFRLKASLALNGYAMQVLNCPSTRGDIAQMGQGVTRDRVNLTSLKKVRIAVPPIVEQNVIVSILALEDDCIRIEKERRDKLIQLKRGLMRDLLTGRVRVNERKLEAVAG